MQLKKLPKTKSKTKPTKPPIQVDDLILKRKGGGSIIDNRPLFSHDGETLFVVWKQVIRAYSVQTGDFVKELEPAEHKIINIVLSHEAPDTIIGCTDSAELIFWNCQNGLITNQKKFSIPKNDSVKIRTFQLIFYKTFKGKDICNGVTSSILTRGEEKTLRIQLFNLKTGENLMSKDLENFTDNYFIDVVGNYGENLVAVAHNTFLYIMSPMHGMKFIFHKSPRPFTCLAGHPDDECVATGDKSGRVLVWKNVSQFNPIKATYHWHTLPVTDVVFSKSGGHMYSGGGECVLVKWLIANPQHKSFLPRLPAPIRYLSIAPGNMHTAVSTLDNGILVVDPQRKITAVIQNFTWGAASSPKCLFPAGLHMDPRTNSLVLNSRTGHIQFYNTHTKSLLYNMNITAQNFLTQERNSIIVNTEVTKLAINNSGKWMATTEERDDGESRPEVRLKFWQYDKQKQNFLLNTSIELPHEKGVNALKFKQMTSVNYEDDEDQFVVTVGKDCKFKLWYLVESEYSQDTRHWRCCSVGSYCNLSALDASFSHDGSLLGVGFGSSLTLWVPETNVLKHGLSYSRYPKPIIRIEFAKQESCHLVVTASVEHLAVWDLLSLTVKWSVPTSVSLLTADPLSNYMATFTTDNTLIVFTPGNPEPVYIRKKVVDDNTSVVGACFVPKVTQMELNEESSVLWQKESQLFFLDSEQELLTLESKSEANIALENLSSSRNLPLTTFNRLVAVERVSNVEKPGTLNQDYSKGSSQRVIEEFLAVPAHTMPPMRMLCVPFILSLMGKLPKDKSSEKTTSSRHIDNEDLQNSDSEEESAKPSRTANLDEKPRVASKSAEEFPKSLVSFNWSSLSSILPSSESAS
ncbi:hypothetical protein QAD02_016327 [Eretmocerus hayati]|uniref:Uncharacterized protein n=1 Tax=Eretmocerus hayati TaxID=131215 RepID=A0ACC2PAV5_9HYME|nr:hypothetical protein QAD02_016327 [Eretmocerus hayati]